MYENWTRLIVKGEGCCRYVCMNRTEKTKKNNKEENVFNGIRKQGISSSSTILCMGCIYSKIEINVEDRNFTSP